MDVGSYQVTLDHVRAPVGGVNTHYQVGRNQIALTQIRASGLAARTEQLKPNRIRQPVRARSVRSQEVALNLDARARAPDQDRRPVVSAAYRLQDAVDR